MADKPGLFVRSGANSLLIGLFGGLIGAGLGIPITWAAAGAESSDARSFTMVAVVPGLIGGLIAAWANFSASAWSRGVRQFLIGAVVGAAAGLIGFGLANLVFDAVKGSNEDLALVLGWAIVAALIGLGLGLLRSVEKALAGVLGGLAGGLAGGFAMLAMGVNQRASFWPMLAAVGCASILVGLAIGGAERVGRSSWIDVLDGPLGGREVPIDKPTLLIGSNLRSDVHLGLDRHVVDSHARLVVSEHETTIEPIDGAVLVNGYEISGPTPISDEQVTVGTTHFVVRRRG